MQNAIVRVMQRFNKSARSRHLLELQRHARRGGNLGLVEFQRKFLRNARVVGYPYWMVVGVTSSCQLECPGCPKGRRIPDHRRKRVMSYEDFKHVINQVKPYVFNVAFNAWGEAFLNKQIFKMIRYAAEQDIGTLVSANLNDLPAPGPETCERSGGPVSTSTRTCALPIIQTPDVLANMWRWRKRRSAASAPYRVVPFRAQRARGGAGAPMAKRSASTRSTMTANWHGDDRVNNQPPMPTAHETRRQIAPALVFYGTT
jgi:hypothetical protein